MPNRYYNNDTNTLVEGTRASATDVEAKSNDVASGLDIVESEMDDTIGITNEDFLTREITENATARANKSLGFDEEGQAALISQVPVWRGDYTATTYYSEGDHVRDVAGTAGYGTNAILFCNTAHTATGLDTDEILYWVAVVDVTVLDDYILKANKWATEAEGVLVDDGTNPTDYSAYHYAQQAKLLNVETLTALDAVVNANTVTDVFIYDTTQDDDGGAWVKQTRNTAWYSEALNTATRGATRPFPVLAVIVVEALVVTIYDATDPTLPMWMVINNVGSTLATGGSIFAATSYPPHKCKMKNGKMVFDNVGLVILDFITEEAIGYWNSSASVNSRISTKGFAERNTVGFWETNDHGQAIVSVDTNDIAIKADGNMGITVGLVTDAGISTVHPDGEVFDITGQSDAQTDIAFTEEGYLNVGGQWNAYQALFSDIRGDRDRLDWLVNFYQSTQPTSEPTHPKVLASSTGRRRLENVYHTAGSGGLSLMDWAGNIDDTMVAYITSTYNSGWMKGDIRRAWLANDKTLDRSVKAGTLTENGTITVGLAATGADLITYGGFSPANFLSEAYSAELDFGVGGLNFHVWAKNNEAGTGFIFDRADGTTNNSRYFLRYEASNQYMFRIFNNAGAQSSYLTSVGWNDSEWHLLSFYLNTDGLGVWFVDGKVDSVTQDTYRDTGSSGNELFRIGLGVDGTFSFEGELALLRLGAGINTSEQAQRIFEDEKQLFQENAACTLEGVSDAVLSLGYDEITNEIHAATSGGVSTFRGLKRVEADTGELSKTSIAAHNGMVVTGD